MNKMKLNNESLQWIYDHLSDLKQAVVTLDFARAHRTPLEDITRRRADEAVHDLAFSFLMVAMGEHIPKTLWSIDDYSILYGLIMDDSNGLEVTNDE